MQSRPDYRGMNRGLSGSAQASSQVEPGSQTMDPSVSPSNRGERSFKHPFMKNALSKAQAAQSQSASNQLGQIYREEWENWMNQFLPVDRKLMSLARSQGDNLLAESDARRGTQIGFANARAAGEMSRRGLGVSLSNEEGQYLNRKSGLAEVAATAKNVNQSRLHAADRDKAIMSGGLSGGLRDVTQG